MSVRMGPKYQALSVKLNDAARRGNEAVELSFGEIEAMVGNLPASARVHRPWWANGGHSQSLAWRSVGWRVETVDLGLEKVRFTRDPSGGHPHDAPARSQASSRGTSNELNDESSPRMLTATPSVVLIGCVKTKLPTPAPAKDLYTSPLFVRRRAYAELSKAPWFILSSKWGLIEPGQTIAPYDMYLADQSTSYRRAWGAFVVEQLRVACPLTARSVVEIHAGEAYLAAIKAPLEALGFVVTAPVDAPSLGRILQWYDNASHEDASARAVASFSREATAALSNQEYAITPTDLNQIHDGELARPGLYAWWIDDEGAALLSNGLGVAINPGLIYVGEAGATRWPSGQDSKNTLKARLNGILRGPVGSSTFRQSLDAILRHPLGLNSVDEARLSDWMRDHLRVTTWATSEVDRLQQVAAHVLQVLDPPLNLDSMPTTGTRTRLSQLRKDARLLRESAP